MAAQNESFQSGVCFRRLLDQESEFKTGTLPRDPRDLAIKLLDRYSLNRSAIEYLGATP